VAEMHIEDQTLVNAPSDEVWKAIKDPVAHGSWHPFVTRIEGEHRLGAVRTCSVLAGKKPGTTKERCVEEEEGRRIVWSIEEDTTGFLRMVSGWRAGFELEGRDGTTLVSARSDFQPKNLLMRIAGPVVRRKFHGAQQQILGGLKRAVER
jgi:carbon monoxide dehydrogenase subunit G